MNQRKQIRIEAVVHALFWVFIFAAVNVDWTADWFDKSIRPNRPSPLSVLIFPFIFYAHSSWAIPRYLNKEKWKTYLLCCLLIFVVPELVRSGLMVACSAAANFWDELYSRDSFLFGMPNAAWMALTFSFAYRFTKDWFVRQQQIEKLGEELSQHASDKPSEIKPLPEEEAHALRLDLEEALRLSQPYLNPELSLAELAKLVGTTDKKLSLLLNQNMRTNFYDYVNSSRIAAFQQSVAEGKLEHLSIVGLALQCGFKSKSSFYRAFKKETGMSPSQFIQ